jgi:ribosomal protein S3AE
MYLMSHKNISHFKFMRKRSLENIQGRLQIWTFDNYLLMEFSLGFTYKKALFYADR